MENRVINVGLIRRPTFIWKDYISRPPGHWRRAPLSLRIPNSLSISGEEASDQALEPPHQLISSLA